MVETNMGEILFFKKKKKLTPKGKTRIFFLERHFPTPDIFISQLIRKDLESWVCQIDCFCFIFFKANAKGQLSLAKCQSQCSL